MLIGEYTHTLDAKKRLSLPSKFRKEMGKKVVIAAGLDQCLSVYSLKEWERFSSRIAELSLGTSDSRDFNRYMLASASESDVDAAGRILIPEHLKRAAGLQSKVVVTGVYNRAEVWDARKWDTYKKRVEKKADMLAEKLGEMGMI